jgi:hypothetical protein
LPEDTVGFRFVVLGDSDMPVDVLTRSYDSQRTGANLHESLLNRANVNVNTFGKLFTRTVDGQIYAQPLVVIGVTMTGEAIAEAVIVATTRNFVYAFDAIDPGRCQPLWRTVQLGRPVPRADFSTVPAFSTIPGHPPTNPKSKNYRDFSDEIGIVSTPVIDDAKKALFLVAKSKANGQYFNKLHKLDLATGQDLSGSPVLIGKSVQGTGFGSHGGMIPFNQLWQLNRPGLLLAQGNVYLGFGSQGDDGPYHGYVYSYDAATLQLKAVHCTTPDWGEGGIWQSGGGLTYADGFVYYVAGNGAPSSLTGRDPTDAELARPASGWGYGNTIVKLDASSLAVVDWFCPTNTRQLSDNDDDFCSGPVLLPGTNLVLGFGKDGFIYVCDRGGMGKWSSTGNKNLQAQQITRFHIHGTPVYWPNKGLLYLWSEKDRCLAYRRSNNLFPTPPVSFSAFSFDPNKTLMPGGILTLSANGDQDGIIWASHPTDKDANQATVAGTLRAFNADNLQEELWNSDHDPTGADAVGNLAKFCPPVVANGKVYMATFSNSLVAYGLLGDVTPKPLGPWSQASIGTGVLGSASESCDRYTVLGSGRDIWDTADAFHFIYQTVTTSGAITLTARVLGVQDTDPWAKAGVMVRDTLDTDSPNALVALTPGNGVTFQERRAKGAISTAAFVQMLTAPRWLRLVAEPVAGQPGQFRFSGFHSSDGVTWVQVGTAVDFNLGANPRAGLAVCSHTVTSTDPHDVGLEELNLSTFDQVSLA